MKNRNNPKQPSYPPLYFVRITERMRRFFLRLNRRFTHPNVVMWEMVHNMWLAAGISVVAELGIADLLKDGPHDIDDLAEQTGTHSGSLYRVMRMLASQGVFRELKGKRFKSTLLARPLEEYQIRYLILVHLTGNQFAMFGDLMKSVRTGETISGTVSGKAAGERSGLVSGERSGRALFDHIGNEEQRNEWFNKAMSNASKMQVPALLKAFPYKKYGKIIDIGGGEGLFLAAVLGHASRSRGVIFDLPNVLSKSADVVADHKLTGRMQVQEGNFFESVPEGGDLYILKSVLHDWDDNSCAKILGNVHRVMNGSSRLLIIESILDEENHPSFGKMTDILMMAATGGMERTHVQWEKLLQVSGFRIRKIHPNITPHSLIEAEKV